MKVNYKFWVNKYQDYAPRCTKFIVHDEENFCVSGDKVVIK